ncbi:2362_t:CDS:2 [Diversispora eburnea]|uniref:2362_t:CDS:1 n=1 Tax=Diversispora eburnea TaxID=1213867 RepID=A0A9N8YNA0_9GLOM|nr:2362_t:CDS:2 [Diversispora eburnea]
MSKPFMVNHLSGSKEGGFLTLCVLVMNMQAYVDSLLFFLSLSNYSKNRSVIINPKPINLVSKVESPLYDESIGTPEESVRRKEGNARKKKIKGLEKSGGLNPFKNQHNNLNDDFSNEAPRSSEKIISVANEPIKTISSNKQQHKEGVHRRKGFDLNLEVATLRRKALVEPKGI